MLFGQYKLKMEYYPDGNQKSPSTTIDAKSDPDLLQTLLAAAKESQPGDRIDKKSFSPMLRKMNDRLVRPLAGCADEATRQQFLACILNDATRPAAQASPSIATVPGRDTM